MSGRRQEPRNIVETYEIVGRRKIYTLVKSSLVSGTSKVPEKGNDLQLIHHVIQKMNTLFEKPYKNANNNLQNYDAIAPRRLQIHLGELFII